MTVVYKNEDGEFAVNNVLEEWNKDINQYQVNLRIQAFEELLAGPVVDMEKLRALAFYGIPHEKGIRALVWMLLLNYMPKEINTWAEELAKKRQLYQTFTTETVVFPMSSNDHPLSISPNSEWNNFFKDNEVLLQIDKDARRLCPDINFFQTATEFPCIEIVNSNGQKRLHTRVEQSSLKISTLERKGLGMSKLMPEVRRTDTGSGDYRPLKEGSEAHWEVVERMLFIYAKLNSGQSYVQGMNEIIGPLYHTFACNPVKEYRQYAEADCFFCFTNLMAEIRDFFIRTLDDSQSGIKYLMERVNQRLQKHDLQLWQHLQNQGLQPMYYSFRWLTLLLSREFALPEVERIWDSLFSDPSRFEMLINTCTAMIILVRGFLLAGDFSANVKMLQQYPLSDISLILNTAVALV